MTALAVSVPAGQHAVLNPGPRGFSEILYAFTSQVNNNGSAFAGLSSQTLFFTLSGTIAMLIGRFFQAYLVMAMAGSLVQKKVILASSGTLTSTSWMFIGWLIIIILLIGALNFLPALVLGPIVEQIMLTGGL